MTMSSRSGDSFSVRRAIQLRIDSESLRDRLDTERDHGHRVRERRRPPAGRGVRLAHQAGRDDPAGSAVAADDGGGRNRVAGRRPGGARPAGRAALDRPARPGRLRPAPPLRRRAVVGRAAIPAAPRDRLVAAHPRVLRGARAVAPGCATRSTPRCPVRRCGPTFVYRHRQLADDLAAHRDAASAGAKPMVVAVTGASGLVGSALSAFLTTGGHRVIRLVRRPARGQGRAAVAARRPAPDLLSGVDAVVHLAGASIAGRFTAGHKAAIRDSRIEPTRLLAQAAADSDDGPQVFVSASAVGIYGYDRGDALLCEESVRGDGFLADVVADWEAATRPAADAGLRVVTVRTGIVQAAAGGTLRLLRPLFLAGPRRPAGQRQAMAVVDRPRRPDRRLLPRAVRHAGWPVPSTRSGLSRCATSNTRRRWRVCCTGPRCCRCRRSGRGCCWAVRAPANSPRPTSGWCRRS